MLDLLQVELDNEYFLSVLALLVLLLTENIKIILSLYHHCPQLKLINLTVEN